ncbi:MAG: tetratricopeptide repeat protein [Candidatus Dependentiae bacterium]
MRQVSSDKYTIAWFKLAECVARGEREKALGVYRLLSHSIDDPAYTLQLEADILWTFNDYETAISKYHESAVMYKAQQKYSQAFSVWEQILLLVPDHIPTLETVVALSLELKEYTKLKSYSELLYQVYETQHSYEKLINLVETIEPYISLSEQITWYRKTVLLVIHQIPEATEMVNKILRKTIDLIHRDNSEQLSLFVSTIKSISERYYQETVWYLQVISPSDKTI